MELSVPLFHVFRGSFLPSVVPFLFPWFPFSFRGSSYSELVADQDGLIALEVDFEKLLALDGLACLVLQFGDDLSGLDVDDVAGRGVGEPAVNREGDPARLVFERDARNLARGHHGR